ncbi:hypothetical protein A3K78_05055 [Candidatus Bathyarchaeota archaeon RBG_13_52_12]|nr:MAG: hypothetical protein A3K78_05055 [Candidatus Bathyarchaeota archaeon RBG_13_52_12]
MSTVKNYMRKDISTISTEASAVEASKTMSTDKVGYIIALEKGRPVGIVTERDLVLKVMAEDKNPKETTISECMSTPLVTIDPDKSIEEAVETMKKHARAFTPWRGIRRGGELRWRRPSARIYKRL